MAGPDDGTHNLFGKQTISMLSLTTGKHVRTRTFTLPRVTCSRSDRRSMNRGRIPIDSREETRSKFASTITLSNRIPYLSTVHAVSAGGPCGEEKNPYWGIGSFSFKIPGMRGRISTTEISR